MSAANVKDLAAQGFKSVPLEDVIRANYHGVSADDVTDMKAPGVKDSRRRALVL